MSVLKQVEFRELFDGHNGELRGVLPDGRDVSIVVFEVANPGMLGLYVFPPGSACVTHGAIDVMVDGYSVRYDTRSLDWDDVLGLGWVSDALALAKNMRKRFVDREEGEE